MIGDCMGIPGAVDCFNSYLIKIMKLKKSGKMEK
jgi:hypothetical protein